MQGDYTKLCYGLNGEGHSNRQFPAARLICPERVGQESRRKRSVKYLIERTDGSKGDKNPRRNLRMFVRIRKEGGGVKLRCDIAVLIMAAQLYVANSDGLGVTSINAVCGCSCIQEESGRYECLAREAREKEQQIDDIKKAIKDCEDSK